MNFLPALLATCAAALLATALPAQADPRISIGESHLVVTGRAACGCPTHSCQVCTGYDRGNRPIYTSHRHPFICGCDRNADDRGAIRKFHERRANELHKHQRHLREIHDNHRKDLDKVHNKHRRELNDISRERNPRKYHERRAKEERRHDNWLRKIEDEYHRKLAKVHNKHQRRLDEQYRDLLRALR